MIGMLLAFKEEVLKLVPYFVFPFLVGSFIKNDKVNLVSLGILIGLQSYAAWTYIITCHLTNYLYDHFIHSEHSFWDILAFFFPLLFAIMTLIWALKRRKVISQYDRLYVTSTWLILIIMAICC
jgi:hypothetical protein